MTKHLVRRAQFVLCLALGCAPPAAVAPTQSALDTKPPPAQPACPRVERSERMWIGFAPDVPTEDMGLAVDTIVPLQERLGRIFCAPEVADCRPSEVASIELADTRLTSARIALIRVEAAARRGLSLTLAFTDGDWQPEAASLSRYLADCRAPAAAAQ